ncbi:uncharacterized protein EI90DRAFT_3121502 [Cantharellus anzutake]|uniref:uncharacterized protein n=1 Tax=Cantharellus anzutake TaxID=1750568 RepID=UPI0019072586|nr:uncharacterized protein EI90DRAFT_3121502 [Cantharellus anzutake]KAF8334159.1 hypothetical protein EI90DRAFT_3121502 [Cantharellus anzutake]
MDGGDKGPESFADLVMLVAAAKSKVPAGIASPASLPGKASGQNDAVAVAEPPDSALDSASSSSLPIKFVNSPSDSHSALSLARSALAANQSYQQSLNSLAQSLRTELAHSEKLLGAVERNATSKGIDSVPRTWPKEHVVLIREGWVGMKTVIGRKQIFADDSPFHDDAIRHKRYRDLTTPKPFTPKERSALISAVHNENMRLRARELASSGATDALDQVRQLPATDLERTHDGLDWDRIASQIQRNYYSEQRTAQECKIQWMAADRPESADATDLSWDDEEDTKLRSLVGDKDYKQGEVDWVVVATELGGNRLPIHCLRRFLCLEGLALPQPKKGNSSSQRPGAGLPREKEQWTAKEDAELLDAVHDLGAGNWRASDFTVTLYPENPPACAQRYRASLDPTIKKGEWTHSEDEKLREAVAVYGIHWSKEDKKLRQAVIERGIKDWNVVADVVGTRSGQQCQRRWGILQKSPNISAPDNSKDVPESSATPLRRSKRTKKAPRDGNGDGNAKDDVGPNTPDPAADTTTSEKTRSTKRGRRQRKPPTASDSQSTSTSANAMDGMQEVTSARSDHQGAEQSAEEPPRPVKSRPKPKPRIKEKHQPKCTNVEV